MKKSDGIKNGKVMGLKPVRIIDMELDAQPVEDVNVAL
jgi:hypothetical protein